MSVYLDASALVSLIVDDGHSFSARRIAAEAEVMLASDLTFVEAASALALRVRRGSLRINEAAAAFALLDEWRATGLRVLELQAHDVRAAEAVIRRMEHPLRAADATHLMIARRHGADLATFDQQMKTAASAMGIVLA